MRCMAANVAGWLVWVAFAGLFTIQWTVQIWRLAKRGGASTVQTLFLGFCWWAVTIAFLLIKASKLHILWIAPACFVVVVLFGSTPPFRFIGYLFGRLVCIGVSPAVPIENAADDD